MKIGLISDTHGYLDQAVFKHFDQCDEIWHAGDIGNIGVADQLVAFKPFRAVYGNIDGHDVRSVYPEHQKFNCEETSVWITHIGGYPGKYSPGIRESLLKDKPDLFITGHSHILKVMYDKQFNCLHLNPGAAGKYGLHKVRTLLRFSIFEKKISTLEVIELAKR